MKLNKLIYNIKNLPNNGEQTDDTSPSDRQLEFIIDHFRVEVAAQRANTLKSVLGLTQVCNNIKLKSSKDYAAEGVLVMKAEGLPSMATSHKGHIVERVGTRTSALGFLKSSIGTYVLDLTNPLIQSVYFVVGDELYIATKSTKMIREVFVSAVFNSPREVLESNGEADMTTAMDWEYPVPGNLIGSLNNMVINNEFRWATMIKPDLINDGKDAE